MAKKDHSHFLSQENFQLNLVETIFVLWKEIQQHAGLTLSDLARAMDRNSCRDVFSVVHRANGLRNSMNGPDRSRVAI